MLKITTAVRAEIVHFVASVTAFDATTVRVSGGNVSAILDADKTFNGPHRARQCLGTVAELLGMARDDQASVSRFLRTGR